MKRSDSVVLMILPAVAVLAGFWLLVMGPRRQEAAKLGDEVAALQKSVDQQKQLASAAAEAKQSFPDNYQRVVKLGRAVPVDDDTATLFAEFDDLSKRAGVQFRTVALDTAAQAQQPAAPAPPPTNSQASGQNGTAGSGSTSPSSGSTPPPAGSTTPPAGPTTTSASPAAGTPTEASAAGLPLGATVGAAGFPVMPYKLEFSGSFFDVADFIHQLDSLVSTKGGVVTVRGRLLTIDGFTLAQDQVHGFPALTASFSVTTYLTPSEQGLVAGATPSGPATAQPATAPATTATTPPPATAAAPSTATGTPPAPSTGAAQ